jgi:hypothetical protein
MSMLSQRPRAHGGAVPASAQAAQRLRQHAPRTTPLKYRPFSYEMAASKPRLPKPRLPKPLTPVQALMARLPTHLPIKAAPKPRRDGAFEGSPMLRDHPIALAHPELAEQVQNNWVRGKAKSTRGKHRTAVTGVNGYRTIMDVLHPSGSAPWPADGQSICFWLEYATRFVNVETASDYIGGLKRAHEADGVDYLQSAPERALVARTLEGLYDKYGHAPSKVKQEVTPVALRLFCTELDTTEPKWRLFTFTAALMSYRSRRGGEVLTVSAEFLEKHLRCSNVRRTQVPDGLHVRLYDSKNYKGRLDYDVFYPCLPGDPTCPVKLWELYVAGSANRFQPEDFLLRQEDGKPLDAKTFYGWTAEAFALLGLILGDVKIGASSYRVGTTTTAGRIGLSAPRIQQLGDWKSVTSFDPYMQLNDHDAAESVRQLALASIEDVRKLRDLANGPGPLLGPQPSNPSLAAFAARIAPTFTTRKTSRRQ